MTTTNAGEKLVTATDLLNLPDDGYKYELVHGHLVRDSLPGQGHGTVVARLTHLLMTWALREHAGTVSTGDPGFHLWSDPDTVRGQTSPSSRARAMPMPVDPRATGRARRTWP